MNILVWARLRHASRVALFSSYVFLFLFCLGFSCSCCFVFRFAWPMRERGSSTHERKKNTLFLFFAQQRHVHTSNWCNKWYSVSVTSTLSIFQFQSQEQFYMGHFPSSLQASSIDCDCECRQRDHWSSKNYEFCIYPLLDTRIRSI